MLRGANHSKRSRTLEQKIQIKKVKRSEKNQKIKNGKKDQKIGSLRRKMSRRLFQVIFPSVFTKSK